MSAAEIVPLDENVAVAVEERFSADGLLKVHAPNTTRGRHLVRNTTLACGALIVCVSLIVAVGMGVGRNAGAEDSGSESVTAASQQPPYAGLAGAIQLPRLMTHLEELARIAASAGGSRSVENGHNASVDYVVGVLRAQAPSLRVWTQPFQADMYKTVVPPTLAMIPYANAFVLGVDFQPFHGFVGAEDLTADVVVPAGCDLGCNATDFAGFVPGTIALIKRGGCAFDTKVGHAVAAGAAGVLVYNDGTSADRIGPFRGRLTSQPVPSFALSFATGMLLRRAGAIARMAEETTSYTVTTLNVLAETSGGDPTSVVTVGMHLDSVPEGPGINDDGTGTATGLEIAIAVHRAGAALGLRNRVRFAWWGAEEIGLLGSKHYVSHLNATNRTALGHIALNLDFDMLGSPNWHLGVYDGRNAAVPEIRNASGVIQDIFTRYFDAHGYADAWTLGPFDGRSDYAPFTWAGIPAGGIYAGAEKIKTVAQRADVGGLANAPYDPCYHLACDTVANVDHTVFELMAKAAADAVETTAAHPRLRAWLEGALTSAKVV